MSALVRGATSCGSVFISSTSLFAVAFSTAGSLPPSVIVMSRPVLPGPPPDCDWNETRASGILFNRSAQLRWNSTLVIVRFFLSVRKMFALPTLIREKADWTSGAAASMSRTPSATASVRCKVAPGVRKMRTWLKSLLRSGWNVMGMPQNAPIVARNDRPPSPTVHSRWSARCAHIRDQRVVPRNSATRRVSIVHASTFM